VVKKEEKKEEPTVHSTLIINNDEGKRFTIKNIYNKVMKYSEEELVGKENIIIESVVRSMF
jgi:hypothetical protein